ncbi:MAG TPA: hypothetical protein V6C82_07275 [Chroococcales cyanobacterium]
MFKRYAIFALSLTILAGCGLSPNTPSLKNPLTGGGSARALASGITFKDFSCKMTGTELAQAELTYLVDKKTKKVNILVQPTADREKIRINELAFEGVKIISNATGLKKLSEVSVLKQELAVVNKQIKDQDSRDLMDQILLLLSTKA